MHTFRNKHFKERDYECTNVVACRAQSAPNENYLPCAENVLDRLQPLYTEFGVQYFGWL